MEYESIIGLEVHAQLSTKTKIFCGCSTAFGAEPNTQTCPVCLGMPGVLPVLNKKVVEYAIKMGIATNAQIMRFSKFARKNYFYPDLPKGYQISQYDQPICENGYVDIDMNGKRRRITIIRIHLEEDAGKSMHDESYVKENESFIDLNRCGVPLIEIVSAPDIRSPEEAYTYMHKLRQLVRYLEICDGNMEEGSFRCDANISIRPPGQKEFGTRTELKNMNSFRNVEKALQFEIDRQISILESGGSVIQETLLWDADKNEARSMRGKEESHDYRYFPEPDLVPVIIKAEWLDEIKRSLPELPDAKKERFAKQYEIPEYNVEVLTSSKEAADYFERVAAICGDYRLVSNWVMGEVLRVVKDRKMEIDQITVTPERLAALLNFIVNKTLSGSAAKKVFEKMFETDERVEKIIDELGLKQVSDFSAIEEIVDQVLAENTKEVDAYKAGKTKVFGFFVGQVMKASKGKANPAIVNEILKKKIK